MLVLLFFDRVGVALHFALTGMALIFFGAEGVPAGGLRTAGSTWASCAWSSRNLFVVGTCARC